VISPAAQTLAAPAVAPALRPRLRRAGVLPGFSLSFGFVVLYVGVLVLLPLAALAWKALSLSRADFLAAVTGPRALAAFRLSFSASAAAAAINTVFGFVVAWVLARYRFFGCALVDALVDLPFALPTAVAGIALTAIWSDGWVGRLLAAHGVQAAYSPLGITIALVFVGLPFVVRTVEPVLHELDPQIEEAAAVLGASRLRTFFSVILPTVAPAMLTGFSLAFARALGEYGSVVFISGNMPLRTEIVPLLIVTRLEQFDYAGATGIAVVMLAASFAILLGVNLLHARILRRRVGR
jgi:sulfate transport system permease protein